MTNKKLLNLLKTLNACPEAVEWVDERDLCAAWEQCEREDWMLWLAGMMSDSKGWPNRKYVILTAIECGRLSLEHAGKYRKQLSEVFDVAERCANNPSAENISAAWSAESAARSAESAARSAARSAAESAAWSAESAAWRAARSAARSAAESAARSAAESAAWSAESAAWSAESAAESAESAAHKKMCSIIRKRLQVPIGRRNA